MNNPRLTDEFPWKVKLGDGTIVEVQVIGRTFLRDFWAVETKDGEMLKVHLHQFIAQPPECPCKEHTNAQEPL